MLPVLLLLGGMTVLVLFPQAAAAGAADGLRRCAASLLPALFPFFVLTRFCAALWQYAPGKGAEARMQRFFGLSGACLPALILSFVGGYPVGVSAVCALYRSGQLSKQVAERCLTVCNNSGPAFFVAVIGTGVFGSVLAGLRLYGIHVAAALLCARCFARPGVPQLRIRRLAQEKPGAARAFSDAITGACTASLQISATVVLFSVLLSLLRLVPGTARLTPLIGLLELTSGVVRLTASPGCFVLAAFYMGWGGLCVHLQAMALWGDLRPRGYLAEKLLHGLLSAIFAVVFLHPAPFSLLSTAALCALCILFPTLRKKRAGNLRKSAL